MNRAPAGFCPPGLVPRGGVPRDVMGPGDQIIVPAFGAIAFGQDSGQVQVKMPEKGRIIGFAGCSRGDGSAAGMSSLGLQLQIGSRQAALVTDGSAAQYAIFATLFGLDGSRFFEFVRPVTREELWYFTVKNFHAATTYTPTLSLLFTPE